MSETAVPVRRPRRWPLYVSLFLNVVLMTVVAIGMWNIARFRDRMELGVGPWMPRQVERVLREDADAQAKVKVIREANHDAFRALFKTARAAHDAVRTAIDADPFDANGLRAALKAKADADQAIAVKSGEVMVEIASVLTPEQRKLVRDKIRRRGPGGPGKDHRRDPSDDDRGPPPDDEVGPPPPPGPEAAPPPPPGHEL